MKQICIVPKGLEDQAIKEIKGKVVIPGRVLTENVDINTVQSAMKVYEYWGQGKVSDLIKWIDGDIKDFFKVYDIKGKVKIDCHREGEHDFISVDVERKFANELLSKGYQIDMKSSDMVIFVDIINDDYIYGLDLTPKLLSKRDYRIKIHKQSINACIAYCLVRLSEWKKGILLDPFCKDGIIPIEAAIYREGDVIGYDSLFHNVRSSEINCKLSEVDVKFARFDASWLDTRFDDINTIISAVPFPSKTISEGKIKFIYQELFKALKETLSGKAVFIAPTVSLLKDVASDYDFKLVEERVTFMGKAEFRVVVFKL